LKKRFHIQHELGGVPSWALTKELFDKARDTLVVGRRPVSKELLDKAKASISAPGDPPTPPEDLLAATRSLYDTTGTALIDMRKKLGGK